MSGMRKNKRWRATPDGGELSLGPIAFSRKCKLELRRSRPHATFRKEVCEQLRLPPSPMVLTPATLRLLYDSMLDFSVLRLTINKAREITNGPPYKKALRHTDALLDLLENYELNSAETILARMLENSLLHHEPNDDYVRHLCNRMYRLKRNLESWRLFSHSPSKQQEQRDLLWYLAAKLQEKYPLALKTRSRVHHVLSVSCSAFGLKEDDSVEAIGRLLRREMKRRGRLSESQSGRRKPM